MNISFITQKGESILAFPLKIIFKGANKISMDINFR